MELRHLRYFVAVAEELHFGRAASKLNIAQPALSLQIQSLEKELGVKLLLRNTRSVELTEAGAIFYKRSLATLSDVETTSILTQIAAGEEITKIRIGTIYPATLGFLPRFLSKVKNRYPDIQLHIKSDTTDNIIRDIERGNLNIGFVRPPYITGLLDCTIIRKERYLLAVGNDSPLAKRKTVRLDDLTSHKIIYFARSNLTYTEKYFGRIFRDHGLLAQISYTCDDTLSLISLVSAGLGVGFVPEWVQELPKRNFMLREVAGIDLEIGLGVAWKKDDPIGRKDDIVAIAQSFSN
jgi:DNA-binding transcriptional LysR family regulator